jgi:hypothetical protein
LSIETTLTLLVAALILVTAVCLRLIVIGFFKLVLLTARLFGHERAVAARPARARRGYLRRAGSLLQFVWAHAAAGVSTGAGAVRRFTRETGMPAYHLASGRVRSSMAVAAFPDPLTGPLLLDGTEDFPAPTRRSTGPNFQRRVLSRYRSLGRVATADPGSAIARFTARAPVIGTSPGPTAEMRRRRRPSS